MGIARNLARVIADNSGAIAAGNLGNAIPADGSITTAKLSSNLQGVIPGFKNKLINGSFQIWQRATSSTASGYVCADRWQFSGSGNVTQAKSSTPDSPSGNYSLVCTSNAASTYTNVSQAIENVNVYPLRGKTVTVSFYVKLNSGSFAGQLGIALYYSNSVDTLNLSTGNIVASSGATYVSPVIGSWTRVAAVYAIPSDAVGLSFQMNVSSAQASGTSWAYADAQIEIGSVVTAFDYRSFANELFLCQRFYEQMSAQTTFSVPNGSYLTHLVNIWQFRVPKRASPTVSAIPGASIGMDRYGIGPPTVTGSGIDSSTQFSARANFIVNTNFTCGEGVTLQSTYWQASAEL